MFTLAKELDLQILERRITRDEVYIADEAFFTGTTTQIASIAILGEHRFYENGNIGKTTKRLQETFAKLRTMDTSQSKL